VGDRIRRHVGEVLAQQGHLMVVTARSANASALLFPTLGSAAAVLATFQHVALRPCTEALQTEMMEQEGLAEEQSLSLITTFRSVWPASHLQPSHLQPSHLQPSHLQPSQLRSVWPASPLNAPGRCASSTSAAPGAATGALVASVDNEARSPQRVDDEARSPQRVHDEARSLLSTPLLLTTLVAMVRRHARRADRCDRCDEQAQGAPRWPTYVEVLEQAAAPRLTHLQPSQLHSSPLEQAAAPRLSPALRLSSALESAPAVRPCSARAARVRGAQHVNSLISS
jgi:hypothetical protein